MLVLFQTVLALVEAHAYNSTAVMTRSMDAGQEVHQEQIQRVMWLKKGFGLQCVHGSQVPLSKSLNTCESGPPGRIQPQRTFFHKYVI